MPDAGDIVVGDFPGATGVKRRPVVILSSDVYHSARPDLIVGLVTSRTSAAVGPTDCILQDWSQAGLHRPSAFRAYLTTLLNTEVSPAIGRLSDRDWDAVRACVKRALTDLP